MSGVPPGRRTNPPWGSFFGWRSLNLTVGFFVFADFFLLVFICFLPSTVLLQEIGREVTRVGKKNAARLRQRTFWLHQNLAGENFTERTKNAQDTVCCWSIALLSAHLESERYICRGLATGRKLWTLHRLTQPKTLIKLDFRPAFYLISKRGRPERSCRIYHHALERGVGRAGGVALC